VSAPLNAGGVGLNELDTTFGPRAVFAQRPPRINSSPEEGGQYVGEVAIDAQSKALTVRLRDIAGTVLWTQSLAAERQ